MEAKTRTLRLTRTFDAPRAKVWDAFTKPEMMKKWWGPKDWTCPVAQIDLRVGGKYLYCMRGAMGPGQPEIDAWGGGEYTEVVPMEKFSATDHFADKDGNYIDPKDAGMPGEWPEEMTITVTFEDAGAGKTTVSITHTGHSAEMAPMAEMGWNQQLDKLPAIL